MGVMTRSNAFKLLEALRDTLSRHDVSVVTFVMGPDGVRIEGVGSPKVGKA
jgi:hypothetical protein